MSARTQNAFARTDFFISYTKTDEQWAEWIAWQLEQEGFRCVIQAWDFAPGQDFVRRMKEALDSSQKMIAVLSDDYFKSQFAQAEMQAAFAASILVPVRVARCSIPKLFSACIYVDLVDADVATAQNKLIDGVRASLVGSSRMPQRRSAQKPAFPGGTSPASSGVSPTPIARGPGKVRVLFLGSEANTGLDIRGEYRAIRRAVKDKKAERQLQFKAVFDTTAETLFEQLNEHQPHVFHFAGKQDAGRIVMNTNDGGAAAIDESALAGMFRSLDEGVRLVIIDTCYSLDCARQITEAVDCAIGIKAWIYEDEATSYYEGFYRALASGRSLADCAGQAASYAQMQGVPKARIPTLCCRRGVDPKQINLTVRKRQ